jgi:hypothetical protein
MSAATYKVPYARRITAGIYIIAAAGGGAADSGARAAESRAYIAIGAHVQAIARIQSASEPRELRLSTNDLRRGFVDVEQPTSLLVNSNSPNGIALDLTALSPMLSSMIVYGLGSEQALGADGGTLIQRWERPQSLRLALKFRLVLAPGLAPGRYPWPLRLDVRPL